MSPTRISLRCCNTRHSLPEGGLRNQALAYLIGSAPDERLDELRPLVIALSPADQAQLKKGVRRQGRVEALLR